MDDSTLRAVAACAEGRMLPLGQSVMGGTAVSTILLMIRPAATESSPRVMVVTDI
jgi:hypothetical protein